MAKPLSLAILYTANIRGDLAQLPRLYTFLQHLKQQAGRSALLLDLGRSCADSIWHCQATGGRSTLIVLDGMGYHAANIEDTLDSTNRELLAQQVTMGLVDRARDWAYHLPPVTDPSIRATVTPTEHRARLQIMLSPAKRTWLDGNVLNLEAVLAGQIGEVCVDLEAGAQITSAALHELPPNTPPNPSIAGAVDFVEAEARYHAKKRL